VRLPFPPQNQFSKKLKNSHLACGRQEPNPKNKFYKPTLRHYPGDVGFIFWLAMTAFHAFDDSISRICMKFWHFGLLAVNVFYKLVGFARVDDVPIVGIHVPLGDGVQHFIDSVHLQFNGAFCDDADDAVQRGINAAFESIIVHNFLMYFLQNIHN
jgi:hypothetical protein